MPWGDGRLQEGWQCVKKAEDCGALAFAFGADISNKGECWFIQNETLNRVLLLAPNKTKLVIGTEDNISRLASPKTSGIKTINRYTSTYMYIYIYIYICIYIHENNYIYTIFLYIQYIK